MGEFNAGSTSDQQLPRRQTSAPKLQSLRGERGGDRIRERQPFTVLAAEPVSAILALKGGELRGLPFGASATKRRDAMVSGVQTRAQQLCEHVGPGEFGCDV